MPGFLLNKAKDMELDRRHYMMLGGALGVATGFSACSNNAGQHNPVLDVSTPKKQFEPYIKLVGSQSNERVYVSFGGVLWGVRPEQTPEPICGFQGLARTDWQPNPDGSYTKTSFDIGYFSDLHTNEPLTTLVNPLTNETVRPFRFKYGGALEELSFQDFRDKKSTNQKWTIQGNQVWMTERLTGEFPAPLSPRDWPRESAGETFRVGSETSYVSTTSQLVNPKIKSADYTMFWSSLISWEPWLLMDGDPGFNMWRGVGRKLTSIDEVPQQMIKFIEKEQPNYFEDGAPWVGRASTYADYKLQRSPQ